MALLIKNIVLKQQSKSWIFKITMNKRLLPTIFLTLQPKASLHQNALKKEEGRQSWLILYKLPSIRYLRFVSRFKIYQIMFMSALCCPLYFQYTEGLISKQLFCAAVGGSLGTSIVFLVFSYFVTRVIGELAVNTEENLIEISRLTFNGGRTKDTYSLDCVVPFSDNHDVSHLNKGFFQKLYIEENDGSEHCYLFSTKFGLYKSDLFDKYIE